MPAVRAANTSLPRGWFQCGCAAALLSFAASQLTGCASENPEGDEVTEEDIGALPNTPLYASTRTQSPMTKGIAQRLQQIRTAGRDNRANVFVKVGDSQTVNGGFMHCFAGSSFDLADHDELESTRTFFLGPDGTGKATFARQSSAAKVGAAASWVLGGPLTTELAASRPRYAIVMYGSNDIQLAPSGGLAAYAKNMKALTDTLLKAGVIPILTSPPPRPLRSEDVAAFGSAGADVWAPRFATVVRGIAQGRQIPFVDLQRELRLIPKFGIGSDNLHLNTAPLGACKLDAASLQYGTNVRNFVTLEALSRVRPAVESGVGTDTAEGLTGGGTEVAPFVVPDLPFADLRSHRQSSPSDGPGVCASASSARFVYRFTLSARKTIYFGLHGAGASTLHVRGKSPSTVCKTISKNEGALTLDKGEYEIVVGASSSTSGEFLLTAT